MKVTDQNKFISLDQIIAKYIPNYVNPSDYSREDDLRKASDALSSHLVDNYKDTKRKVKKTISKIRVRNN